MKTIVVTILLLILFVFLFVALFLRHQRTKNEKQETKIKVFQFNSKFSNLDNSDEPSSPFLEVIKYNKFYQSTNFSDANLLLFSDFSYIDQNLGNVPFRKDRKYFIYGIKGSDEMANKALLANHMIHQGHHQYIPKSFVLDNPSDIEQLIKQHESNSVYIIKKNVQRQEGNLITKDIEYITSNASKDDYVVCQELLQNPYIVNGRKINMRVYMLVVIQDKKTSFYVYNNGFMYYTPKHFKKGSVDKDVNITTGYIDRKVYDDNPLTHKDFYDYLGKDQSIILQNNMMKMFVAVKNTYEPIIFKSCKNIPGIKFNIFGVDVAPDENLNTMMIEINKGPDLSYKDERDKNVKLNLVIDCFSLVGLTTDGSPENFLKI